MADHKENTMVEMIVVRGTVCAGVNVKRGDRIEVPSSIKKNGVYPVRWWVNNRKAARNQAEFEEFCADVDAANPAAAAPPAPAAKAAAK